MKGIIYNYKGSKYWFAFVTERSDTAVLMGAYATPARFDTEREAREWMASNKCEVVEEQPA